MRDIAAVMVTVDRTPKPNYLAETLENLARSGAKPPRPLVIADSGTDNGWSYPDIRRTWGSWVHLDQTDGEFLCANLNVARALRLGAKSGAPWVLFLEDDIDVVADFFDSVGAWLDDHAREDRHLYAFGANYAQVGDLAARGIHAWDYPIEDFYGTQAIAVRAEDAPSLADYLEEHCFDLTPEGTRYDHLMRGWAKERWPEIDHFLASCPSFVQHTGRSSVIDPREVVHVFPSWPGREWSYLRRGEASTETDASFERSTEPVHTVAVLTPFRNARRHLDRYFRQLTALRDALAPDVSLRLVAAEGDSKDGTRQAVLDRSHETGIPVDLVPTDHGLGPWGSVEDPERMRAMSGVMNAALSAVEPQDDLVVWLMSDLEWSPATLRDLIRAAADRRGGFDVFAPMVYMPSGAFYDTWAYRKSGQRFQGTAPYHPEFQPGKLLELDSAGTCLAMRAEVARAARATTEEAVSWCASARRQGARIAVSDRWELRHDPPARRRVLWVGDAVAPTGFARCTHGVLPTLSGAGWEIEVVGVNYWGVPHDYPYKIWPAATGPNNPFGERRLAQLVHAEEWDAVVLLTDPWHVPTYTKAIEVACETKERPPVVGWLAVDAVNQRAEDVESLDRIITWTDFARRELQGHDVVPLAVDRRVFRPHDRDAARAAIYPSDLLPQNAFVVGCVGRNQWRKRMDLLLRYFADWIQRHGVKDAYLYLQSASTGGRGGCDIPSLIRYYGLTGRVLTHFEASATEPQMRGVYSAMDVYATTSMGEGWGLPVGEAMACGVPCIVPEGSGLGEWTKDAALQVPCREQAPLAPVNSDPWTLGGIPDREAFIEALHRMYTDRELREDYARRGMERVAGYSWRASGEALVEILEDVMDEAKQAPKEAAA